MIKTLNLIAGQEMEIEVSGGCHCCIENRGSDVIYASKAAEIVADGDEVTAIDGGSAKVLRNVAQYKKSDNSEYDYSGTIYILSNSDGKAEIQTANDLNFFKSRNTSKGGETYDDSKIKADIEALQADKVDKDENKVLSDNNYTDEEKEKLANLKNYDDTALKADIKKWEYTSIFVNSTIKSCNNAIETGNYRLFSSASNKPNNLKFGDMRVLNSENMIIQSVFFIDGDNASKIAMRNSIDNGVNWSSWTVIGEQNV